MPKNMTDLTFRQLCGDTGWELLLAYEPCLQPYQVEFLAHMQMERDRLMSAGQADWASELIERAKIHQRIEQGSYTLPLELDFKPPPNGASSPPAQPPLVPPRSSSDDLRERVQASLWRR